MSHPPLRFVHSADFHLDEPAGGVPEVPDHLRDLFIESVYWAAERVFETARAEHADFLVLSGDLLAPARTGPRGPRFLTEQFETLDALGIRVYWAGSRIDSPPSWPESVRLPKNVHHFATGRPEELLHQRDGQPVARVVGASRAPGRRFRPNDFLPDPQGRFTVAVAHGRADPEMLKQRRIDYWALGGVHRRRTLFAASQTAHYPGTPQGRRPAEEGDFGCTLVDVDSDGRAHLSPVPTQLFRWHHERVMIDAGVQRPQLETLLRERLNAVVASAAGSDVLVGWTVAGGGPLAAQLRHGSLAGELLEMLRGEFGYGPPAAWSVSLQAEPALAVPEAWFEEESVRGDFLRAVRQLLDDPREPIELDAYLPQRYRDGSPVAAATLRPGEHRRRVLAQAAMLGVDLLTGEESQT